MKDYILYDYADFTCSEALSVIKSHHCCILAASGHSAQVWDNLMSRQNAVQVHLKNKKKKRKGKKKHILLSRHAQGKQEMNALFGLSELKAGFLIILNHFNHFEHF